MTTVPSMGKIVERGAHRFDGGLVGGAFVAAADLRARRRSRPLP